MARKLPNGHYLVPQLLDKVVREYTPDGKVVWEAKTPDMPFTAIRLPTATRWSAARWVIWSSRSTRAARSSGR